MANILFYLLKSPTTDYAVSLENLLIKKKSSTFKYDYIESKAKIFAWDCQTTNDIKRRVLIPRVMCSLVCV